MLQFTKQMIKTILLIGLLSFTASVSQAKTLVLLHGYMEDAMDWHDKGATLALKQNGWVDGGVLAMNRNGIQKYPPHPVAAANQPVFYTVELPWARSVAEQSRVLDQYLQKIYQHRREPISLAGHSNGGLVARYYLVMGMQVPINALITVASPHRGAPIASVANLANEFLVEDFLDSVGMTGLKESKQLLDELKPEEPHTFLNWLNNQPHPSVLYHSIVRENKKVGARKYDYTVPADSQNMNYIAQLRGRSSVTTVKSGHGLTRFDGWIIHDFLNQMTY